MELCDFTMNILIEWLPILLTFLYEGTVYSSSFIEYNFFYTISGFLHVSSQARKEFIHNSSFSSTWYLPAIHSCVSNAEGVPLIERRAAKRAREAVHVEHQVPSSHHQLRRTDRQVAARATFWTIQSGNKRFLEAIPLKLQTMINLMRLSNFRFICTYHRLYVVARTGFRYKTRDLEIYGGRCYFYILHRRTLSKENCYIII